jgi:acetoin utilization protein AcuB
MWMTKDVVTVPPDMPIMEARDVMKQHMVRRLPVLQDGKLVGIVTQGDIQEAGPSGATSLSIWELNYLLARITVEEIMTPLEELVTVSPDEPIEVAADLMRKNKVGGLPVVEDADKLVGIITESDIFDIFIELLGVRRDGTRLTLELEDRPGALLEALEVLKAHEANVLSIVTCEECRTTQDHNVVVLRIDLYDWRPIVKELKDKGIKVLDART